MAVDPHRLACWARIVSAVLAASSASADSGSRSTNIKCWDIHPERWEEALQFAIGQYQARGLSERAVIAGVEYLASDPTKDALRVDELRKKYPDVGAGLLVIYGAGGDSKGSYKLIKPSELIGDDPMRGQAAFDFRGENAPDSLPR